MNLRIATPLTVIVDEHDVRSVRAEDDTGSFGILPGHAEFLTSLAISVVSWTRNDNSQHYCAVRSGTFTVTGGQDVAIATREALASDDIAALEGQVIDRFRADIEIEKTERAESNRLHMNAIRQIMLHLKSRSGSALGNAK